MSVPVVTIDLETFFSQSYTLTKMTTEAYVRDKQFEPHGAALRTPDGNVYWITPLKLKTFFEQVDWSELAILCHHAQFDGLIMSHYYRVRPKIWLDTLSMARMVHGNHISNSLASLAKHYRLPAKSVPYTAFRGKHWDELPGVVQQQLAGGGMHDVHLTYELFTRMLPYVPDEELVLIDMTIRMFTEPVLRGDIKLLDQIEREEIAAKKRLLADVGITDLRELRSDERFATILKGLNIIPATKYNDKGDEIYAFAKTDKFMQEEILENGDDHIRALGEARVGTRSTIEQSRAARFKDMATRGALPVYLAYHGAHTSRWSGGDKLNWQNLRRGSDIRRAIRAPAGQRIIKVDKSQQECRYLTYLAGQWDKVEEFKRREDPYIKIASEAYQEHVYKAKKGDPRYEEMLKKRGSGKLLTLSCGYGAGAATIQATARPGTYGPPVLITLEQALGWRNLYRKLHPQVVNYWYEGDIALTALSHGDTYNWGIFRVHDHVLELPNGCVLQYPELAWVDAQDEKSFGSFQYKSRYGLKRIWGGKLVENVIQAVSRVDIGQCMLRLQGMGYRIVLMEHDALAIVVKEASAERDLEIILGEMRRAPDWLPDIPLDAEGSIGETYA